MKPTAKRAANKAGTPHVTDGADAPQVMEPALRIATRHPVVLFRRAGLVFRTTPVVLRLAALSAEQIERIRAERNLVVEDTLIEAEPEAEPETQAD